MTFGKCYERSTVSLVSYRVEGYERVTRVKGYERCPLLLIRAMVG